MGTDISMYAEKIDPGGTQLLREPTDNQTAQFPEIYYGSRNYELFAILADVRNPTGRTADNRSFETIVSPRGLPADLSAELRDYTKDGDICSPSWLLLSEILQFDWYGKVMCHEAMVDACVAHLFEEGKPFPFDRWPLDIETSYAIYMLDGVTVRWTETYANSATKHFMEFLERLKQQGEPSQIRLVFWFGH